jgi:hypothetical protein
MKNKTGDLTVPYFKTYYEARVGKTVMYRHNTCTKLQTDSTEVTTWKYSRMLINKAVKTTQEEEDNLFNKQC